MGAKKYNIFVSYAWADNQPFEEGAQGWISTFVDRLRKLLGRELPREYAPDKVWLDYEQLRGSDSIKPAIRAKLEASRILMPIVSRAYLDSPWCTQEREIFLDLHGPDAGLIFPIWMSPVDVLPPPLDDLLKYRFWFEDGRKKTRTRWFPDVDPTDREYGFLQQDLARDLAERITEIRRNESSAPDSTPVPRPTTAPPAGDHLVLVNGGEDDAALVQQVADRLGKDHQIGAVVPLAVLPDTSGLKSSEIARDLRDKLKLCTAMLMVYKDGPLHQIHHQFTEFRKTVPKRPKDSPNPILACCHAPHDNPPPGIHLPQMRSIPCGDDCAGDCVGCFVRGLT